MPFYVLTQHGEPPVSIAPRLRTLPLQALHPAPTTWAPSSHGNGSPLEKQRAPEFFSKLRIESFTHLPPQNPPLLWEVRPRLPGSNLSQPRSLGEAWGAASVGGATQAPKSSRIGPHPPIPTLQAPPLTQSLEETNP